MYDRLTLPTNLFSAWSTSDNAQTAMPTIPRHSHHSTGLSWATGLVFAILILPGCDSTSREERTLDEVLSGTDGIWFVSESPLERQLVPPPCVGIPDGIPMEDGTEWCYSNAPNGSGGRYESLYVSASRISLEKISGTHIRLRTVRETRTWLNRRDPAAPEPDAANSGFERTGIQNWVSSSLGTHRSYHYKWSGLDNTFIRDDEPCVKVTIEPERIVTRHECSAVDPGFRAEYSASRADPFNVTFP